MSKEEFRLENKISSLFQYIDKEIYNNIPKNNSYVRNHLMDEIYSLQKNIYIASINKGNILSKSLNDALINLMMIDTLFGNIKNNNYVKNKKIETAIGMLSELKTIIYGWKKNTEKDK